MILSDKSPTRRPVATPKPAAPVVAEVTGPAPKATCPGCGRPIVLVRAATCLYCGASVATAVAAVVPAAALAPAAVVPGPGALPPEILFALEPRPRQTSARRKWLYRIGASLLGSLIAALLLGPCSQVPPGP